MSRDFDKAQEMVWASMEYVKVLGFRIRRTEVQRDDWKQVAQSHADEMIKLRQHVDALKAERDAEREALGIQAAKEAGKALGMVDGEGLRGAAERVVKERERQSFGFPLTHGRSAFMSANNNWTPDRPTQPGEYWVSIEPSRRVGVLPTKGYPHAAAMFLHGRIPCVGINGIALELKARCFDGAKWSRRETPADPFEE